MVMMIVVMELMNLQNIVRAKEELALVTYSHAITAIVCLEFIFVMETMTA